MVNELNIVVLQSPGSLGDSGDRLAWLEAQLLSDVVSGSDLLVLPELFQCGYNAGSHIAELAEPSDGPFAQSVARLAITHGVAIAYGYAETSSGAIYNSARCVDSFGHAIGHHRKLLLPPGFETALFEPGNAIESFALGGFTISILICYDVEFPENMRQAAAAGADLVIVPTALSSEWGIVSEKLVPTRAFENGVFLAYANHCGIENNLNYYGGSCIVSPTGHDLARLNEGAQFIKACLKQSMVAQARARLPYLNERMKLPWVSS